MIMGLFGFGKEEVADINETVKNREKDSILIDVREPDEYAEGHIPGSMNIPVGEIGSAELSFNKDAAVYVYCQTGMRASKALRQLKKMGYTNVKNTGGILSYTGKVDKGEKKC